MYKHLYGKIWEIHIQKTSKLDGISTDPFLRFCVEYLTAHRKECNLNSTNVISLVVISVRTERKPQQITECSEEGKKLWSHMFSLKATNIPTPWNILCTAPAQRSTDLGTFTQAHLAHLLSAAGAQREDAGGYSQRMNP